MELEPIQTGVLGVNTWIVPVVDKAVFIVDPSASQLTGDENVIIDYLEKNDYIPLGIFLTHGHFDHIMGLKTLKAKYPGICIAIHKSDAECIGSNSAFVQEKFLSSVGADTFEIMSELSQLPSPDVILEESMTFDKVISPEMIIAAFSGNEIAPDVEAVSNSLNHWSVIHTPGHSKGSVCFYNDAEKVLISGDTIFYGTYGRTDLYGGSDLEIKKSICRVVERLPKDAAVYPGHDAYGFTLGSNYF